MENPRADRQGFTLVELLVVVTIILGVSAVVLPTVMHSYRERDSIAAAQIVQAAIVGARDAAVKSGTPAGIRFLPDPSIELVRLPNGQIDSSAPLACNRFVPIETPGNYRAGTVSTYPGEVYPPSVTGGLPCLVIEGQPGEWSQDPLTKVWSFLPIEPVSWNWNIRLGEKVSLGVGKTYVVCGPMAVANPEAFVNMGASGSVNPLVRTYTAPDGITTATSSPEFLLLVNDSDDNGNGYINDGFDGIDNNQNVQIDDPGEWESEAWMNGKLTNAPYWIFRRPATAGGPRTVALPSSIVLDLSAWQTTRDRTRAAVSPWAGTVDLVMRTDGQLVIDSPYGVPSSIGMNGSFVHLWLADRSDIPVSGVGPLPPPKEDARLISVSRSGRISVLEVSPDNPTEAFVQSQR
jgi:prepilin-type N-terminal cleavage/methylation domain-containing protein